MHYSLLQKIVWVGLALIVVTFLFGPFALGSTISGGARNGVDTDEGLTLVLAPGTPTDITVVWD